MAIDPGKNKIWLIGCGAMAREYAKVLQALSVEVLTIGRGEVSAADFETKMGSKVIRGGLERYLASGPVLPMAAIVATDIEELPVSTLSLLKYGLKRILVEKPGALTLAELQELKTAATEKKAEIYIAYNRRFYSSVMKAREMIETDGGVISFNFEFTEWSQVIEKSPHPAAVKQKWFLANSSHVVDLAFFLGGESAEIKCYTAGHLTWHPSASIFAGSGVTGRGSVFSYQANWEAPGRWGVEMLTRKRRLVLKPLEELWIQQKDSIELKKEELADKTDQEFKPGLFRQTEAFLGNKQGLKSLEEQLSAFNYYALMAGYNKL